MMGAGKSTVGKALAKHLSWEFVDTDHLIEQQTGVSIPTIFEIEGEAGFRRRESQVLTSLTGRQGLVVATGGGIVLAQANRVHLKEVGPVVYLSASAAELYQRTRMDKNRPLLQSPNPRKTIEDLLTLRHPLYTEVSDLTIETGRQPVSHLVQRICDALGLVASVVAPQTRGAEDNE